MNIPTELNPHLKKLRLQIEKDIAAGYLAPDDIANRAFTTGVEDYANWLQPYLVRLTGNAVWRHLCKQAT